MTSDVKKERTKWANVVDKNKGSADGKNLVPAFLENVWNVEWINTSGVGFAAVESAKLNNTLNGNKSVKLGKDGQVSRHTRGGCGAAVRDGANLGWWLTQLRLCEPCFFVIMFQGNSVPRGQEAHESHGRRCSRSGQP